MIHPVRTQVLEPLKMTFTPPSHPTLDTLYEVQNLQLKSVDLIVKKLNSCPEFLNLVSDYLNEGSLVFLFGSSLRKFNYGDIDILVIPLISKNSKVLFKKETFTTPIENVKIDCTIYLNHPKKYNPIHIGRTKLESLLCCLELEQNKKNIQITNLYSPYQNYHIFLEQDVFNSSTFGDGDSSTQLWILLKRFNQLLIKHNNNQINLSILEFDDITLPSSFKEIKNLILYWLSQGRSDILENYVEKLTNIIDGRYRVSQDSQKFIESEKQKLIFVVQKMFNPKLTTTHIVNEKLQLLGLENLIKLISSLESKFKDLKTLDLLKILINYFDLLKISYEKNITSHYIIKNTINTFKNNSEHPVVKIFLEVSKIISIENLTKILNNPSLLEKKLCFIDNFLTELHSIKTFLNKSPKYYIFSHNFSFKINNSNPEKLLDYLNKFLSQKIIYFSEDHRIHQIQELLSNLIKTFSSTFMIYISISKVILSGDIPDFKIVLDFQNLKSKDSQTLTFNLMTGNHVENDILTIFKELNKQLDPVQHIQETPPLSAFPDIHLPSPSNSRRSSIYSTMSTISPASIDDCKNELRDSKLYFKNLMKNKWQILFQIGLLFFFCNYEKILNLDKRKINNIYIVNFSSSFLLGLWFLNTCNLIGNHFHELHTLKSKRDCFFYLEKFLSDINLTCKKADKDRFINELKKTIINKIETLNTTIDDKNFLISKFEEELEDNLKKTIKAYNGKHKITEEELTKLLRDVKIKIFSKNLSN